MYKIHSNSIYFEKLSVGENYFFNTSEQLKKKIVLNIELVNQDYTDTIGLCYPNPNGSDLLAINTSAIENYHLYLTLVNSKDQYILHNYPLNLLSNNYSSASAANIVIKRQPIKFYLYDIALEKSYVTCGINDLVVKKIAPFLFYYL